MLDERFLNDMLGVQIIILFVLAKVTRQSTKEMIGEVRKTKALLIGAMKKTILLVKFTLAKLVKNSFI